MRTIAGLIVSPAVAVVLCAVMFYYVAYYFPPFANFLDSFLTLKFLPNAGGDYFLFLVCGGIAAWLTGLFMHGSDYRIVIGIIGAAISYALWPLLIARAPCIRDCALIVCHRWGMVSFAGGWLGATV